MCNTINKQGLGEKFLSSMLVKNVPGLCVEVKEAMEMLEIDKNCDLLKMEGKEIRKQLKKKVVKIQKERIVGKMLEESKADRILLNKFEFDGREKRYLCELPFDEARIIFMLRSRMFPTKKKVDRVTNVSSVVMLLEESNEKLSARAKKLLLVKNRLEKINISHDV